MFKQEVLSQALANFLRQSVVKVLVVSTTDVNAASQQLRDEIDRDIISFDISKHHDLSDRLETISKDKPIVFIFLNVTLENYFHKYQLDRWQSKNILVCDAAKLHSTLSASIYFAPKKNKTVQKRLFAQVNVSWRYQVPHQLPKAAVIQSPLSKMLSSLSNHYLNQKSMSDDPVMMQMLADRIVMDDNFKIFLFSFIDASRTNETLHIAAANAITAMRYARVCFSEMDLSSVNIQKADLSGAILDNTILSAANLTNVTLMDAFLNEVDLSDAVLNNLRFNRLPKFTSGELIKYISYSPAQKLLALLAHSNAVTFWDLETRSLKYQLRHTQSNISRIAISYDGQYFALSAMNGNIYLYANYPFEQVGIFEGHTNAVYSLIFSKDNQWLASASTDETVRVWNITKNKAHHVLKGRIDTDYKGIMFNQASSILAYIADFEGTIGIFDLLTSASYVLTGHELEVCALDFSPDDCYLASSSHDSTIRIWDLKNRQPIFIMQGHGQTVTGVLFNSNGRLLASYGRDRTVRLWDATTGLPLLVSHEHTESVSCGVFIKNDVLASCSDKAIYFVETSRLESRINLYTSVGMDITRVNFNQHGRFLVSSGTSVQNGQGTGTLYLWDKEKGTLLLKQSPAHLFSGATLNHDDTEVAYFDETKKGILLLQIPTNKARLLIENLTYTPANLMFNHGPHLKLAWFSTAQNFFDHQTRLSQHIPGGTIHVWDFTTSREIVISVRPREIHRIKFTPDANWIAACMNDNSIGLWDINSGSLQLTLREKAVSFSDIAFSPEGKYCAACSHSHTIHLWNSSGALIAVYRYTAPLNQIEFLSDRDNICFVTSSSRENIINIWSINGQLISTIDGHTNYITSFTINQKNEIATASADGTLKLWRLSTLTAEKKWRLQWSINHVLFLNACKIDTAKDLSMTHRHLFNERTIKNKPCLSKFNVGFFQNLQKPMIVTSTNLASPVNPAPSQSSK